MEKRQQAEFVTDEEQRLLEIEDMRLVVKFGEKRRYSDWQYEAICQELLWDALGIRDIGHNEAGHASQQRDGLGNVGRQSP